MSDYSNLNSVYIPIGTIIPFSSENYPTSYLECNGFQLSKTVYSKLYSIIGVTYGETDGSNGVGTTHFRIPDYTNMFLRGHSGDSASDPDKDIRLDRGDGTTGNFVGTKQNNEHQSHTHTQFQYWWNKWYNPSVIPPRPVPHNQSGGYTVSKIAQNQDGGISETRPDNTRVIHIMRVI